MAKWFHYSYYFKMTLLHNYYSYFINISTYKYNSAILYNKTVLSSINTLLVIEIYILIINLVFIIYINVICFIIIRKCPICIKT